MKLVVGLGVLLAVLCLALEVEARAAGPPVGMFPQICTSMMPNHGGASAQSGNGGYVITTNIPRSGSTGYSYMAGQTYTVTLTGSTNNFVGFLVIAHVPSQTGMLLGRFIPQNSNQQTLDCDSVGASTQATVAHSNPSFPRIQFTNMTFMWEAPSGSDGVVDFRYTVVRAYSTFYVRQSAAANDPGTPATTAGQLPPQQTTAGQPPLQQTTTDQLPPDTETTTESMAMALSVPNRAAEEYRLTFRSPTNCTPSACDFFVGIDTNSGNSGYLDIYLEGQANGWVAVGFTKTSSMSMADVVACNRNPNTDMATALDAWNVQGYGNDVDDIQNVVQFSGSYSGRRIKCSVAKQIAPSGNGQDLNLNEDYFVLYGRLRGDSSSNSLRPHEMGASNPRISSSMVNPATAGGSVSDRMFPRLALLRFHGILMIIAWPLLAVCGIFFATWMRQALPNGEWFQVHRAFLLTSMFVGAAGFAVAFIANYPSGLITFIMNPVGTAHFAIGIIVMALHIANPIVAIFRCKPAGEHRWIFNLLHGTIIGVVAEVLGLANVSLGTNLIFRRNSAAFWVFIAYCIVNFVIFVALVVIYTVKSCLSKDSDRKKLAPALTTSCISSPEEEEKAKDIALSAVDSDKADVDDTQETEKPKKVPSKDSPLRWASLVVYLAITTPLLLATIVLVAALDN